MRPKEKAKELVDKYVNILDRHDHYWGVEDEAKKCALLLVEEVQMSNPTIKGNSKDLITMIVQTKAYWHQVANEIRLL